MRTNDLAQAGTLESMDCLVTITAADAGRDIALSGASVSRFATAMKDCINATLDELEQESGIAKGLTLNVQDNGALDIVLKARVEAAWRRFIGRDA